MLNKTGDGMSTKEIATNDFRDFLMSRIFEKGELSSEEILKEIEKASSIDNWSDQKQAFNEISGYAPMKDLAGFSLKYEDVPAFIERECAAFCDFFN